MADPFERVIGLGTRQQQPRRTLKASQTLALAVRNALYTSILRPGGDPVNSRNAFIDFEYRKTYMAFVVWNLWAAFWSPGSGCPILVDFFELQYPSSF